MTGNYQGTQLNAVYSSHTGESVSCGLWVLTCGYHYFAEHLDPSSILKLEVICSSKMLVTTYKTTQHQKTTFHIESLVFI
jgi:hypothetical protein